MRIRPARRLMHRNRDFRTPPTVPLGRFTRAGQQHQRLRVCHANFALIVVIDQALLLLLLLQSEVIGLSHELAHSRGVDVGVLQQFATTRPPVRVHLEAALYKVQPTLAYPKHGQLLLQRLAGNHRLAQNALGVQLVE